MTMRGYDHEKRNLEAFGRNRDRRCDHPWCDGSAVGRSRALEYGRRESNGREPGNGRSLLPPRLLSWLRNRRPGDCRGSGAWHYRRGLRSNLLRRPLLRSGLWAWLLRAADIWRNPLWVWLQPRLLMRNVRHS